ncbi:MAG TPA: translation elongation factor Ts [Fimbriimonadaceae bacterium]|nr:translation elongation factor Ts [Fimbriimonadaceae bacterium]
MAYTAADVKRLRELTDAPMMECKAALDEANGDFERAKEILREKGKAAAGKKAGRATGAGVVAIATNGQTAAGVVLECETDFVSRNEDFVAMAQQAAEALLKDENADLSGFATEAVAKFRENAKIGKTVRVRAEGPLASYVHHDRTKGAIVAGRDIQNSDALRKVAIQVVASTPEVVSKDQLSQEKLNQELEIETRRAMEEGKPENIAKNIAQGRVNKEFIKRAVLLEQPFYVDANKTVAQFLAEEAKGGGIEKFEYLAVGQTE